MALWVKKKKRKKSLSFGVSKVWVIRELRAERIHNEKEKRMKIGKQGKTLSEWKSEWGREIWGETSLWEGFLCPAWPQPESGREMVVPKVFLRNWGTGREGWSQEGAQQSAECEGPQTNPLSLLRPRAMWELQPGLELLKVAWMRRRESVNMTATRTTWRKTVGVGSPLLGRCGRWWHSGPTDSSPWNPGSSEAMGLFRNPELTEIKALPLSTVGAEKGNLITEQERKLPYGHNLAGSLYALYRERHFTNCGEEVISGGKWPAHGKGAAVSETLAVGLVLHSRKDLLYHLGEDAGWAAVR